MPSTELSEQQAINLVRNALLVAGIEMGTEGDHWPVIKTTVHSMMKDWEDLQVERNVADEMKIHLYAQLEIMERGIADCQDADIKEKITVKLKQLREVYDAHFSVVDTSVDVSSTDLPVWVARAKAITDTLESDNA
jgi:hypothetical protein